MIKEEENGSNDIKTAVTQAVDYCIDKNIMSDFLIKHKAEVVSVCITEFDEKIYEAELREEGREEGLKKGREEGLKIYKHISVNFGISEELLTSYINETDTE